jgi:hypothetical protein
MFKTIKSRTGLVTLIIVMALVFCFQLGTQIGRSHDEAAADQLEVRMAQMDQQMRSDSSDSEQGEQPAASVDRGTALP